MYILQESCKIFSFFARFCKTVQYSQHILQDINFRSTREHSLPMLVSFTDVVDYRCDPYITDIQLSDQDTHLWICDCFNQTIREIDLQSGETCQLWTNERLERKQKLIRPGKLAVSPDRVFVSDAGFYYRII